MNYFPLAKITIKEPESLRGLKFPFLLYLGEKQVRQSCYLTELSLQRFS